MSMILAGGSSSFDAVEPTWKNLIRSFIDCD